MRTLARAVTSILIAAVIAMALSVTWTTGLFWWVLLACVAASLGIFVGQRVIASREDAPPDLEPVRDVCDLESCAEPSAVEFAGGNGPLYICAKHAGPVSAWAPVVGVRMPYDRENGVA